MFKYYQIIFVFAVRLSNIAHCKEIDTKTHEIDILVDIIQSIKENLWES